MISNQIDESNTRSANGQSEEIDLCLCREETSDSMMRRLNSCDQNVERVWTRVSEMRRRIICVSLLDYQTRQEQQMRREAKSATQRERQRNTKRKWETSTFILLLCTYFSRIIDVTATITWRQWSISECDLHSDANRKIQKIRHHVEDRHLKHLHEKKHRSRLNAAWQIIDQCIIDFTTIAAFVNWSVSTSIIFDRETNGFSVQWERPSRWPSTSLWSFQSDSWRSETIWPWLDILQSELLWLSRV